jgi:hypothetical protein
MRYINAKFLIAKLHIGMFKIKSYSLINTSDQILSTIISSQDRMSLDRPGYIRLPNNSKMYFSKLRAMIKTVY